MNTLVVAVMPSVGIYQLTNKMYSRMRQGVSDTHLFVTLRHIYDRDHARDYVDFLAYLTIANNWNSALRVYAEVSQKYRKLLMGE